MRLLILGGTRFVGRHVVEAALKAGHSVTLFNRGRTDRALFPEAEHLVGDRSGDHAALAKGRWDAVIDVSGYRPEEVRGAMKALSGRCGWYGFVSSVSIYREFEAGGAEDAPTWAPADVAGAEVTPATYGPLKAACEKALREGWKGPWLSARAGLVAGPHDPTDRFTYWAARAARGGAVLAPSGPEKPVQFVDARDLGEWLVACAAARTEGIFNADGPPRRFGELLDECADAAGGPRRRLVWADDAFLLGRGLHPYTDLPLWVPGETRPFDVSRARAAGLRSRPAVETAADVLRWHRERGEPPLKAGLRPDLEARLLAELGAKP